MVARKKVLSGQSKVQTATVLEVWDCFRVWQLSVAGALKLVVWGFGSRSFGDEAFEAREILKSGLEVRN